MPATARAPGARRGNVISQALQVLGDRWTLLILRGSFMQHIRRYQDWRDALGISDSVLAGRLRDLVAAEVFEKVRYGDAPVRHEYRLTERGLDLWTVLVAIWAWECRWSNTSRPMPELVHLECGERIATRLVCGACLAPVGPRDTRTTFGPGFSFDQAVPPRYRRRSSKEHVIADPQLLFAETMAVIGDRWTALVAGAALVGTRRFIDFQRVLSISPTLLSQRLQRLTALGVLEHAARGEYRLTPKGRALFDPFMIVIAWAERWMGGPDGPALLIEHRGCGETFAPALGCERCGLVLERRALRFDRVGK